MIGAIIRLIQKAFPAAFTTGRQRLKLGREKYKRQLETLTQLLTLQLDEKVWYDYESDRLVVVVKTEVEILARITIHAKGALRRNTYVKVHTDKVPLVAWFQLAFLGMKVTRVPYTETLLLTDQRPRGH